MRYLFVFPLLFLASVAHAEPTVQTLQDSMCADTSSLVCAAFVGATIDAFETGADKALKHNFDGGVFICLPPNTSWFEEARQVMRLLKEDLSLFPADKALDATGAIAAAAMKIWPCHK